MQAKQQQAIHQQIIVHFNQQAVQTQAGISVENFLVEHGWHSGRFIVVINDEILPKTLYDSHVLNDADRLDVLSPITGG